MTSIYLGISGLNVAQQGLNTTAHNLANVETKGYVRQQYESKDFGYQTVGVAANHLNQTGFGVTPEVVRQVRDRFYDARYRLEVGRKGFYEIQYEIVREVEDIFGELEGVSFKNSMNHFWEAIQELSKEPDSIVTRTTFVKTAETFLQRAKIIDNQLKDYQRHINDKVIEKVNRINEIGENIVKLNEKIRMIEAGKQERANDLRDSRNLLLDELGELIDISYIEDPMGVVNVYAETIPFINDGNIYRMDYVTDKKTGMIDPVWRGLNEKVFNFDKIPNTLDNDDVGSLKGILLARGKGPANYTDIPERWPNETEIDYQMRLKEYNSYTKASLLRSLQSKLDRLVHGIVTGINDVFAPNVSFSKEQEDILVSPVTLPDGRELKAGKVKVLADDAPIGMDENHTKGEALFDRIATKRYETVVAKVYVLDENGNKIADPNDQTGFKTEDKTFYVYNEEDPNDNYTLYTISELQMNVEILNNYSKLPLHRHDQPTSYDVDTINKLLDTWNKPFATLGPEFSIKTNFSDYYNAFISNIANVGATFREITENQKISVEVIDSDRQNFMGVNSDEELTNLIRFQHSYNAASRYINVINEMLDHLINRM